MMHTYLLPLKEQFEKNRNEALAVRMKQYMKDQYAYFGIPSPLRRNTA